MTDKKPRIKLNALEKTVVHTPTQYAFNKLMRVYECGGCKWVTGDLPTKLNVWSINKKKTCVNVTDNYLTYNNKSSYRKDGYTIIPPQEFYKKQNPETIKIINELIGGK